jgi:glucokinase
MTGPHDPERLPSQLIWPASGILTLILDKAAAALLPPTDEEGCGVLERELMILAGDVGGTKVHLALYDFINGKLEYSRDERYPAKEYSGLEEIVKEFLGADKVTAACFGVPGPVRDGRLRLTNLPWTLDSRELAQPGHHPRLSDQRPGGQRLRRGRADADQIYTLSEGDASQMGNRALIAAGTGLGEGFLIWNGHSHVPYPSEGGHADYAPRNEDEIDLLRFLKQKYNGRISYERVGQRQGLTNIYEFLREVRGVEEPAWLAERMAPKTPMP